MSLQDDADVKARKISQMPLVYSQATVTMVASRASEANGGFLRDRPLFVNEGTEASRVLAPIFDF